MFIPLVHPFVRLMSPFRNILTKILHNVFQFFYKGHVSIFFLFFFCIILHSLLHSCFFGTSLHVHLLHLIWNIRYSNQTWQINSTFPKQFLNSNIFLKFSIFKIALFVGASSFRFRSLDVFNFRFTQGSFRILLCFCQNSILEINNNLWCSPDLRFSNLE